MGHKLVLRTTPSTPLLRSPCLLVKEEEEEEASRSSAQVQLCSLGLLWREVGDGWQACTIQLASSSTRCKVVA